MRILYHHRTRAEDAQGIHIEEIQRAFRQLGHEVREVALMPRGVDDGRPGTPSRAARLVSGLAAKLPRWGYELAELSSNAVEFARLRTAIREFRPDIIYERYSLHNSAGVMAAKRAGIPLILEVNSPLAAERTAHGGLSFPRLGRRVEGAIWKAASAIVTVSSPLADAIAAAGVPRQRILVLHNGVRREMLTAIPDRAGVRARYGIAPGEVVCGFTGWFRAWHGLETLLERFADARLDRLKAKVMLVGDGGARPVLEEIVRRRGLGRAVVFTGQVGREAIADHIAAFDIALQPAATPYASPMKIFEYLALGKPVVAAATPAIAEVLADGRESLLFAVGDHDGMVERLERMLRDEDLRARLSAGARQTIVRDGRLWDENARRTLEHLADLATNRSWRSPLRPAPATS